MDNPYVMLFLCGVGYPLLCWVPLTAIIVLWWSGKLRINLDRGTDELHRRPDPAGFRKPQ